MDIRTLEWNALMERFGKMRLEEQMAIVRSFDTDLKDEVVRLLRLRGTDKALVLVGLILWTPSSL